MKRKLTILVVLRLIILSVLFLCSQSKNLQILIGFSVFLLFQIGQITLIIINQTIKAQKINFIITFIVLELLISNGYLAIEIIGLIIIEVNFYSNEFRLKSYLYESIFLPLIVGLRLLLIILIQGFNIKISLQMILFLIVFFERLLLIKKIKKKVVQQQNDGSLIKDQQVVQIQNGQKEKTNSIDQNFDLRIPINLPEDNQSLRLNNESVQNKKHKDTTENNQLNNLDQVQKGNGYFKFVKLEKSSFFLEQSKVHKEYSQFSILNLFPFGCVIIDQTSQVIYQNSKIQKIFGTNDENEILGHISRIIQGSEVKKKRQKSLINLGSVCSIDENQFQQIKKNISYFKLIDSLLNIPYQGQDSISRVGSQKQNSGFHQLLNLKFKQQNFKIQIFNSFSNQEAQDQNIILIIIKDESKKASLVKLKKQHLFQNQILQSFSHELRTPLNCSIQSIQAAIPVQQDQQNTSLLKAALGSNLLLLYQINDILDSAALENKNFKYQWTYFTFQEVIDEIMDIYQESFQIKGLKFIQQTEQKDLKIQIRNDKGRIMQILVNLINNSIKYTAQDGIILLLIEQQNNPYSRQFKISIIDNGIGIDQNILNQINLAFANGLAISPLQKISHKQIDQYIGLGLTNCYKLAAGMSRQKKQFQVFSEGQGTSVSFYVDDIVSFSSYSNQSYKSSNKTETLYFQSSNKILFHDIIVPQINFCFDRMQAQKDSKNSILEQLDKIEQEQNLNEQLDSKVFKENFSQSQRAQTCAPILIVDDIPFNHLALKAMLSSLNLDSESVYDGEQAVQKVKERSLSKCQTYSLILMDIQMPKMNGFQATKEIKSFLKGKLLNSTILMCSAFDTQENIDEAYQQEMDGFLFKPIRRNNLQIILKQLNLIQN